jgi:glyoxalase family protein
MAGNPRGNLAFYTEVLGQRLIKKTVNFDDPGTYHLYYGDRTGRPGTALTFFPFAGIRRGRAGAGAVTETAYSIPVGSLGWWERRLTEHGVPTSRGERFGEAFLAFTDPDGMGLALIEADEPMEISAWPESPVPAEHELRGFHSVTGLVHAFEGTERTLTQQLGYRLVSEEGNRRRYETGPGGPGTFFDIVTDPAAAPARPGAGVIHHVAFATPDDANQADVREALVQDGYGVSGVRDRQYFHSIYFQEPNGILFEVATEGPGFLIDEPVDALGQSLKLPPQYEAYRDKIEANLPPLQS